MRRSYHRLCIQLGTKLANKTEDKAKKAKDKDKKKEEAKKASLPNQIKTEAMNSTRTYPQLNF